MDAQRSCCSLIIDKLELLLIVFIAFCHKGLFIFTAASAILSAGAFLCHSTLSTLITEPHTFQCYHVSHTAPLLTVIIIIVLDQDKRRCLVMLLNGDAMLTSISVHIYRNTLSMLAHTLK